MTRTFFDEPEEEPKFDFVLFDHKRMRFVTKNVETGELFRRRLTTTEAVDWNERFKKSSCRHLSWQKSSETSGDLNTTAAAELETDDLVRAVKHRNYVIRRD
jgi:predicted SprT family Zn-dependent metalloprotease